MGKLGIGLVGSYLGYQAQNLLLSDRDGARKRKFQQGTARRLREELGELKGVAMKVGQLLSLNGDLLQPEALAELAQLQMRAPGMHPTLAAAQIKATLGRSPQELFRSFEPEPFAAASLGQVHRAVAHDGQHLAVKVQYPAIRSAIENDFKYLRSASVAARLVGHTPGPMLDELERGILAETDYGREADNIERFAAGLRHLEYLQVPRVRRDLSGDRVLTMSFLPGEGLERFLERRPSGKLRNLVGERIVESYHTQLQRLKAIHADPHPGNYLFQPDGRIGLVDFGCVVQVDLLPLIDAVLRRSWRASPEEERRVLHEIFGTLGSEAPLTRARHWIPVLERTASNLFPEDDGRGSQVIDYSNSKLGDCLRENLRVAVKHRLSAPKYVFSARSELGLYHLLRRLEARVNLSEIWQRVAAAPIKDAPTRARLKPGRSGRERD